MKIKLQRVQYMPNEISSGVLYVSDEFDIAIHLCACGCGVKVKTPLGATEWRVEDSDEGVTLYPSVGNWQQKCQSHYWIYQGKIFWAESWSKEKIAASRRHEERRRQAYYDVHCNKDNTGTIIKRLWIWWKEFFD